MGLIRFTNSANAEISVILSCSLFLFPFYARKHFSRVIPQILEGRFRLTLSLLLGLKPAEGVPALRYLVLLGLIVHTVPVPVLIVLTTGVRLVPYQLLLTYLLQLPVVLVYQALHEGLEGSVEVLLAVLAGVETVLQLR